MSPSIVRRVSFVRLAGCVAIAVLGALYFMSAFEPGGLRIGRLVLGGSAALGALLAAFGSRVAMCARCKVEATEAGVFFRDEERGRVDAAASGDLDALQALVASPPSGSGTALLWYAYCPKCGEAARLRSGAAGKDHMLAGAPAARAIELILARRAQG